MYIYNIINLDVNKAIDYYNNLCFAFGFLGVK